MAEDRYNLDTDMPSEWQLMDGRWEYIPVIKPISETLDTDDAVEHAARLDIPVSDDDVSSIDVQSDDTDDLHTDTDDMDPIDSIDVETTPVENPDVVTPPVDHDVSFVPHPVSEPVPHDDTDIPDQPVGFIPAPIQDDSFALSFNNIAPPISEAIDYADLARFGLQPGFIPAPIQDTNIDIEGLVSGRTIDTSDETPNDSDENSDELPLI
jgi:hypothetical protein